MYRRNVYRNIYIFLWTQALGLHLPSDRWLSEGYPAAELKQTRLVTGPFPREERKKLSALPVCLSSGAQTHALKNKNISFSSAWGKGQARPSWVIFEYDLFHTALFSIVKEKRMKRKEWRERGDSTWHCTCRNLIITDNALIKPRNGADTFETTGTQVSVFRFKRETHPSASVFYAKGKDVRSAFAWGLVRAHAGSQIPFAPIWDQGTSVWFRPLIPSHSIITSVYDGQGTCLGTESIPRSTGHGVCPQGADSGTGKVRHA